MKILSRELGKSYFFCYNRKVSVFLKERKIPYITIAKDLNTNRIFSLYQRSSELESALKEFAEINK